MQYKEERKMRKTMKTDHNQSVIQHSKQTGENIEGKYFPLLGSVMFCRCFLVTAVCSKPERSPVLEVRLYLSSWLYRFRIRFVIFYKLAL